jgi:hypothetical protein
VDVRGGRRSSPLVLAGNHFGARVVNNHLLGGEFAFRLMACATETPVMWGWSHTPYFGGVVEGNVLEDAEKGGILGVEHDGLHMKSNRGRTYMSVKLDRNIVRWSEGFLNRVIDAKTRQAAPGLTLGYAPSHDAGELIVTAKGNRVEVPAGREAGTPLLIHAATFNSQRVVNRRFTLSSEARDEGGAVREAGKNAASRSR